MEYVQNNSITTIKFFHHNLGANNIMHFWFIHLTTRQVIIIIVGIAVAFSVVWYVIDALEGFDPNYRPGMEQGGSRGEPKESYGAFDPTKKKSASPLSTTLDATCEYHSVIELVSCTGKRTSDKSILRWKTSHSDETSGGDKFEFSVSNSSAQEVTVTLEECIGNTCNQAETAVTLSK